MSVLQIKGKLIDSRHIEHIDQVRFYTVREAADALDCSPDLVYKKLIHKDQSVASINPRHTELFTKRSYNTAELADMLNLHRDQIYKLRMYGYLEQSPMFKTIRIPSWSIIDFLDENSYKHAKSGMSYIAIPINTIRIIGSSIADYIASRCSEI